MVSIVGDRYLTAACTGSHGFTANNLPLSAFLISVKTSGPDETFSDCPKLSPPQNGVIDNYSLSKGTSVLFACDMGYTLFGEATLTCEATSTWDYAAPVCLESK